MRASSVSTAIRSWSAAIYRGTPVGSARSKCERLFGFGGLWESWKDRANGETVQTYTIITGQPNEVAARIHDRMPLIIDPDDFDRWLTAAEPPADILRPYAAAEMEAYPVSKAVNSPAKDEVGMMDRIELP